MKQKYIYLLFSIIFISSLSYSQISISQSEFTSSFGTASTNTSLGITESQTIDIGQLGGNNQWNFLGLVADDIFEKNFILPDGTPFQTTFPDANIVSYFNLSDIENWSYYSTTDATLIGTGNITVISSGGQDFSTTSISTHYPPFNQYNFPITFGKMWTKKDSSEISTTSDQGTFMSSIVTNYETHVDAWGTMTMPGGKVVDALRLKEIATTTSYFFGIPSASSTTLDYSFMGKNGEVFLVSPDNENVADTGEIAGFVDWSGDNVTKVEKLNELPIEFSLEQNYPNPFNPTTTLEYSITEVSFVKLTIYDVLGNEVSKLVNKEQMAGKYNYNFDATNLSSGTYFLQINAGNFTDVKKMVLMK